MHTEHCPLPPSYINYIRYLTYGRSRNKNTLSINYFVFMYPHSQLLNTINMIIPL